jgi:hypothetical protein
MFGKKLCLHDKARVLRKNSPPWLCYTLKCITGFSKGLLHEIEFKYLDKRTVLVVNKYLFWFFNFQNASLMRCRH